MSEPRSVQEIHAPQGICFGCGPANDRGLRIRSFPDDRGLIARFRPEQHHQAFPGVLNGGIVGSLLDCHGNWAAAMEIMARRGLDQAPCTVTAEYTISLRRPCPVGDELVIRAWVTGGEGDRAEVEGTLVDAAGKCCATLRGLFVAVGPGHPAFHRW